MRASAMRRIDYLKSEMSQDKCPHGGVWIGYMDSRDYLGSSDDDYTYKHMVVWYDEGEGEFKASLLVELFEEFHGYDCDSWSWPCCSAKDSEILIEILKRRFDLRSPEELRITTDTAEVENE